MADVQILANRAVNDLLSHRNSGPFWKTELIGYVFNQDDNFDLVYQKTIDGGATWGATVLIASDGAGIPAFDVWPEWDTPGDSGTEIHIFVVLPTFNAIRYFSLETATDVLSPFVNIATPVIGALSGSIWGGIIKTRGGNLDVVTRFDPGAADVGHWRSIDGGASWASRVAILESGNDRVMSFPGNEADANDVYYLFWDTSVNELDLKIYDDSANTVSTTNIVGSVAESAGGKMFAGVVDPADNNLYAVICDGFNGVDDVLAFRIANAASITALRSVVTGVALLDCGIAIDLNGVIYGIWIEGPAVPGVVKFKTSTDNGLIWGIETQYNDDAGALRQIGCEPNIDPNGNGGRFEISWGDLTPQDAETNFTNSIEFSAQIPPSPNPPATVVSIGAGGLAGTILYITPDGREYQLITPHDPGRHVLNFQGFGTPPMEYVTQRGPFQDGETVKDFFARPRTVQLLLRQNFCDRQGWWDGRSILLDEIRPNRQTTPDGTTPGRIRIFRTDGTSRDLRVFISTGPVFEPTVANEWDEWSFQELLRFIAHDPILFSSTQTTSTFVIALDSDLVFPITFPITFGTGDVDATLNITYDGTWKTFPIITIVGPIELPIINNNTTGEKLEFTRDIDPGQTVTIDLTEGVKTVVDQTGANLIGSLTTDSDIGSFHIAPDPEATDGLNVIRLRGRHPTGSTSVSLAFFVRYFGM